MNYRKFSERLGKVNPKDSIQTDYMDQDLKNGLWNIIFTSFFRILEEKYFVLESPYSDLVEAIWRDFLKAPIDEMLSETGMIVYKFKKLFNDWNYYEVYDFIEYLSLQEDLPFGNDNFIEHCNYILKRELSGYRFVNGLLTPITKDFEIQSIEDSIRVSKESNFRGVNLHLGSALEKLSDRQNPDYRNSIKESISAVESVCQQITGDQKAELGKALKKLKEIIPIHGALEQGFLKIYGFTSDSDGIRHALLEEDNLDQEDALYMLVSCSAFINYLLAKWNKLKN